MSAYTRTVSKIAILSDADDAPGGALCSVQPGGNGAGGLYVDLSIAKQSEECNVRSQKVSDPLSMDHPWASKIEIR